MRYSVLLRLPPQRGLQPLHGRIARTELRRNEIQKVHAHGLLVQPVRRAHAKDGGDDAAVLGRPARRVHGVDPLTGEDAAVAHHAARQLIGMRVPPSGEYRPEHNTLAGKLQHRPPPALKPSIEETSQGAALRTRFASANA